MKKAVLIIIALVVFCSLTACGNMGLGVGNFTFENVHYADFAGNCGHATIEKWYESDTGIELLTQEYGSLFLSEGTYILYNGKCPICGE